MNRKTGLFRYFGIATVFIIYFLILVGGLVRTTGSGMGCPDWPKCFDLWVPPVSVDQLPADYKTRFAVAGREIADFSAVKTWIEYINRLIGALTGLMIGLTLLTAWPWRKKIPGVFYYSLACFVGVLIVGWLGAKVVATHLMPGMITIHMLGAVLVAAAMIMALASWQQLQLSLTSEEHTAMPGVQKIWMILIVMAFIQLILGTQVREEIDRIAVVFQDTQRELWVENLDWKFYVHRSFSLVYLILVFLLYKKSSKFSDSRIRNWSFINFALTLSAILAGVVLAYLNMPAWMQPIHLLIGTGICGVLVYLGRLLYAPVDGHHLLKK